MRTYRRLDDPTRYYGLSWRGWLAATATGGVLYLFVRLSPFDPRMTISVVLIAAVLPAMAGFAAGGQALGIGRYLAALIRWALGAKEYAPGDHHGRRAPAGGIVLDHPRPDTEPPPPAGVSVDLEESRDGR